MLECKPLQGRSPAALPLTPTTRTNRLLSIFRRGETGTTDQECFRLRVLSFESATGGCERFAAALMYFTVTGDRSLRSTRTSIIENFSSRCAL